MKKNPSFTYNISNSKRPQILLIGNGLERGCKSTIPDPKGATNQLTWDELVNAISVEKCVQNFTVSTNVFFAFRTESSTVGIGQSYD